MKATGVLLLFFAGLSVFTALSVAVMTADTFRERLHHHRLQRERAHVYAHSPHCRAASRSKLGEFHRCDEAESILASPPPFWHAMVDVSATLPPLLKSVVEGLRQDLHRVVLTAVAAVGLWAWARRYTQTSNSMHPAQQYHTWQRVNAAHTLPMFKAQYPVAYSNPVAHCGPEITQMEY
jgi:hypothetical protein